VTAIITALSNFLWALSGLMMVLLLFCLRKPIARRLERGGGATREFVRLATRLLDERIKRASISPPDKD
jgi:hypothetical protein